MTSTAPSLYDRLGGREAIDAVVEDFYDKLLDDKLLAPWFAGVDMGRQRRAFAAFLRMTLRGGGGWKGRSLRQAHAGIAVDGQRLGDEQFDRVVTILAETLAEHGAPEETIKEVGEWAESVRDEVLGR